MTAKEVMEIIKSAIRPFLVITGWAVFLLIVWIVTQQFLNANIADKIFDAFTYTITLIIGVYIGGRIAKPPESK